MNRHERFTVPGAIALIAAAVIYLLAEAITALAWKNPTYSYATDYISDLGVPGPREYFLNHVIFSPLASVMNTGFILNGLLVIIAGLLLLRFSPGVAPKIIFILVIVYGAGISLVGTVHGSLYSSTHGLFIFHALGACMAIDGGNILLILLGAFRSRYNAPRWFGAASIIIGALGLLSFVLESANAAPGQPGIFERGSVYTLMAFQLLAGITLLVYRSHDRTLALEPADQ